MSTIMKRGILAFVVSVIAVPAFCAATPDEILRSSLALLGQAKRIQLHAAVMNDELVSTGQKLQRSLDVTVKMRRPDGLRMDVVADRYRRSVQYDGKVLAVSDPELKVYGTVDAPATIDATLGMAREKLGIDLPLGYLFAQDAYTALKAKRLSETYVGLHRVNGEPCHHLAYTQENVDWQIWIAADGPPLPRKIVIDFKNRPGRPQYIALLSDWNLDPRFDNSTFAFTVPAGAQKIDFLPAEGGAK